MVYANLVLKFGHYDGDMSTFLAKIPNSFERLNEILSKKRIAALCSLCKFNFRILGITTVTRVRFELKYRTIY